ncbi:MAG TPA: ABC transporter permease [Hyphomicrobiaceae bacterium]|nr:ABC transporter permease [Hyphomicrobiaceae bacterium]
MSDATNHTNGAGLDTARLRDIATGSVTSIAVALLVVIVVGLSSVGPNFLSASNITIIGSFVAIPMLVAAFASFALLAGVVDLSIGSMLGFSSNVCAALMVAGWPLWAAGLAALLSCLVCGAINATAVVIFGADTIAATLGMLVALRGLCYIISGPIGMIPAFDGDFYAFVNLTLGPLPVIFIVSLVVIGIAALIVSRTRRGRHVQAVGGDDRAAARAGISVTRVRFAALLLSAFGAGIGGVLYVGQLGSASNYTGTGLEFQVYAAMMIGGYSILRGGVGNPLGAALGLLVVAGTSNIIDVQAISPYLTNIIVGLLLLAAVLLDRVRGGDAYD